MELEQNNFEERKKANHSSTMKGEGVKQFKDENGEEQIEAGQIKGESAIKPKRKQRSSSSSSRSSGYSRSRTRKGYDKPYRNFNVPLFTKRRSPSSEKFPTRLQSQKIQLKVIIPRTLASDQKQLKYIQQLSCTIIRLSDQVHLRFNIENKRSLKFTFDKRQHPIKQLVYKIVNEKTSKVHQVIVDKNSQLQHNKSHNITEIYQISIKTIKYSSDFVDIFKRSCLL